jgi:hypothetical protein
MRAALGSSSPVAGKTRRPRLAWLGASAFSDGLPVPKSGLARSEDQARLLRRSGGLVLRQTWSEDLASAGQDRSTPSGRRQDPKVSPALGQGRQPRLPSRRSRRSVRHGCFSFTVGAGGAYPPRCPQGQGGELRLEHSMNTPRRSLSCTSISASKARDARRSPLPAPPRWLQGRLAASLELLRPPSASSTSGSRPAVQRSHRPSRSQPALARSHRFHTGFHSRATRRVAPEPCTQARRPRRRVRAARVSHP